MKKMLALAFASILSVTALSGNITAVHASEEIPAVQENSQNDFESNLSQNQIDKFDQYVGFDASTNEFSILPNAYDELTASEIHDLTIQLEKTNNIASQVNEDSGAIIVKDAKSITIEERNSQTDVRDAYLRSRFHEGKTGAKLYWWGVRIWLSRTTLQWFGGGVTLGGIWVPEPLVSKILSSAGVIIALAPGGIAFNSTPPIKTFWGFEWQ